MVYIRTLQDFVPFPTFLCLQDTYHPQMHGVFSLWLFLLFFVCPWSPAVYKMCGFLPPGLWPPFSLLIPNLPAITISQVISCLKVLVACFSLIINSKLLKLMWRSHYKWRSRNSSSLDKLSWVYHFVQLLACVTGWFAS